MSGGSGLPRQCRAHGGLTGLLRPMLLHRVLALLRPCRVFSRETVQNVVG